MSRGRTPAAPGFGAAPRWAAAPAFALLLAGLAACEAWVRPSREARIAAAEAGAAHFAGRLDGLRRSVFIVLSGDGDEPPVLVARGGRVEVDAGAGPRTSALACGVAGDGYLLTAAHVLGRHNWVLGWMGGALGIRPARVVERRDYGAPGAEFAVLRVGAPLDSPLPPAEQGGAAGEIYAMAAERGAGGGIECLAGRAVGYSGAAGGGACLVLRAEMPTGHGDSGGPVLTPDGALIGVDIGWEVAAPHPRPVRTVCCPNPAVIRAIIERDRLGHPREVPPP